MKSETWKEMQMTKQITVGIVGQGRSGRDIHGVYLCQDERFKIVAAADAIAERRQRAAREYGCATYATHAELLRHKGLDLVVNASFSHQHTSVTNDILATGRHVVCEKPLARNVAMVDEMIAAAKKSGRVFAVFQQSRYAPYFQQVRKVIDSGVLGRIVQISIAFNGHGRRWDWQTLQEMHGGHMMNTGPHPLDQALTLYGEVMPDVRCWMDRSDDNFTGDAENHVKIVLSGKGKPVIEVEVSSCCAYPGSTYQVYGTCGGMKASGNNTAEWRYFNPQTAAPLKLNREPLAQADGTPSYCVESLEWKSCKWPETGTDTAAGYVAARPDTNMTGEFYGMLHRTLTTGAPLEITPEQVRKQIAVMEECRRQNPHIYPTA